MAIGVLPNLVVPQARHHLGLGIGEHLAQVSHLSALKSLVKEGHEIVKVNEEILF